LTCPGCGTLFQFRSGPPPGATPRAQLSAPPPASTDVTPAVVAPPEQSRVAPAVSTPEPPIVLAPSRKSPSASKWRIVLLVLVGVGVLAGGVVLAVNGLPWRQEQSEEVRDNRPAHESKALNYRFVLPAKPWTVDRPTQLGFKAQLALRRTDPNAWLVIVAKDYKNRTPRESDLVDEAIRLLRTTTLPSAGKPLFQNLEWERKPDSQLAGKPALQLEFQGESNEVVMNGDCVVLTQYGMAYWYFTWASLERKGRAAEEWTSLRNGFHLLKEREGWQERLPKQVLVQGKNPDKAAYTLSYTEGIWQGQALEGYDEKADLALLGYERDDKDRFAEKSAVALVLLLPKQSDLKAAVTAARTHLRQRQEGDGYPNTTITPIQDSSGLVDRADAFGNVRGHLAKLRVRNTEERERYVVQAILHQPDYVLVLQCECDWQRQPFWEEEFTLLRKSFRFLAEEK